MGRGKSMDDDFSWEDLLGDSNGPAYQKAEEGMGLPWSTLPRRRATLWSSCTRFFAWSKERTAQLFPLGPPSNMVSRPIWRSRTCSMLLTITSWSTGCSAWKDGSSGIGWAQLRPRGR